MSRAESLAAFEIVRSSASTRRQICVDMIAASTSGALTCDEVEVLTGMRHQTCSARFSELRAAGTIVASGEHRKTRSGANAMAMRLADKGN